MATKHLLAVVAAPTYSFLNYMRISISPINFGGEQATVFLCDNHRITRLNVISTISFWTASGRKLSGRDVQLTNAQYLEWCALDPTADDDHFLTTAHAATLGLTTPETQPTNAVYRVSRDTIWNRVKEQIGQDAALTFLAQLPEAVRLEFLANTWFHSDNVQVRQLLASIPELDVEAVMAIDPYI